MNYQRKKICDFIGIGAQFAITFSYCISKKEERVYLIPGPGEVFLQDVSYRQPTHHSETNVVRVYHQSRFSSCRKVIVVRDLIFHGAQLYISVHDVMYRPKRLDGYLRLKVPNDIYQNLRSTVFNNSLISVADLSLG